MNLFDYFTGFDRENYEAGLEADRKRIALNAAQLERKRQAAADDEEELRFLDELEAAYARNDAASAGIADGTGRTPDESIGAAFVSGLADGRNNIRNGVGSTINELLKNTLGLVPWQLWVAGAVVALWHLGWLPKLLTRARASA